MSNYNFGSNIKCVFAYYIENYNRNEREKKLQKLIVWKKILISQNDIP